MEPIFSNVTIILCKPKYPENIGSAARAMKNMGFNNLIVVAPQNFDIVKVKKTATHESIDIVNTITVAETLEEALENANYIVGTTARLGRLRQETVTPAEMALKIIPLSQNNNIAILFGPEDKGLENHEINQCDCLVTIPTLSFSSINLAQSVMVLCYEIAKGIKKSDIKKIPRLAGKKELEKLFKNLDAVLNKSDYVNTENPEQYFLKFRKLFSRLQLRSGDVLILNSLMKKLLSKLV